MSVRPGLNTTLVAVLSLTALLFAPLVNAQGPAVTTYHYDNYRTGWNSSETILTQANVNATSFGLLQSVRLDDQSDTQPLYVPSVNVTAGPFPGIHNVVYVATGNNTVYAIDAQSGQILLSPNFGPAVRYPLGCNNNGPNVGITSTPVIDLTSSTMYVMVYSNPSSGPQYQLHALDLGSLTDKVPPQTVVASHTLSDGSTFSFNATYQRQRPALLMANGNIYAGFGSFCDFAANVSRGWMLGWEAGSLTPLAANQVFDIQSTSPDSFFLSSIWMSGYGPAADDSGNVLAVTGNSDYSGTTYDGVSNIQESVIKLAPDLSSVLDLFTPSDWSSLDQSDADFGSGGVMILPDQVGGVPHLAVATGKEGNMFFMNEDNLGGYSLSGNNVLGTYYIGSCWCGESYFVDSDGAARVVGSGNQNVSVWKLSTAPAPSLSNTTNSPSFTSGQFPGFFTSISSNGNSNAIIWALARPASAQHAQVTLYAFNPDTGRGTMKTLFRAVSGEWPHYGGDLNQVPVVANGEVFVASNKQLRIFGLKAAPKGGKK